MFNATSGDSETDTIESYETWLEDQLLKRVNQQGSKTAKDFLASKGVYMLDTKKRYKEVMQWMEEYAQQSKVSGVSDESDTFEFDTTVLSNIDQLQFRVFMAQGVKVKAMRDKFTSPEKLGEVKEHPLTNVKTFERWLQTMSCNGCKYFKDKKCTQANSEENEKYKQELLDYHNGKGQQFNTDYAKDIDNHFVCDYYKPKTSNK